MCERLYKTVPRTPGQFVQLVVTVPRLHWNATTVLMS
jgi:hypothetical protein